MCILVVGSCRQMVQWWSFVCSLQSCAWQVGGFVGVDLVGGVLAARCGVVEGSVVFSEVVGC